MAITTYSELLTALENWTHRDDTDFTDRRDEFLAMAEARMYDDLILKNMEAEETLTLTADRNYVAIPSGYVSPIALWLLVDTVRVPLDMVLPQQLPYYPDSTQPTKYAIDGDNIRFDVPADQAYTAYFRMVKKSNLSSTNTTNYLLTRRPDIYLAACMVEYARWAQDPEVFNAWEPKYLTAKASLKAAESRSRDVGLRTEIGARGRSNIITGE